MTKPHERLDAWVYSMQLVKEVYNMMANFPPEERFGLTSQMRHVALFFPGNMVSGNRHSRVGGNPETVKGLVTLAPRGSLKELEIQAALATMLGFTRSETVADELCNRAGRGLTGIHKKWSKA